MLSIIETVNLLGIFISSGGKTVNLIKESSEV